MNKKKLEKMLNDPDYVEYTLWLDSEEFLKEKIKSFNKALSVQKIKSEKRLNEINKKCEENGHFYGEEYLSERAGSPIVDQKGKFTGCDSEGYPEYSPTYTDRIEHIVNIKCEFCKKEKFIRMAREHKKHSL